MSYSIQADLADDGYLRRRVTACAAVEGIASPDMWASEQRWVLSAQPGWVEAYAGVEGDQPDSLNAAITDAMILTAVQALKVSEPSDT